MTPRIQKAIDIFLDALNEGTLAKGTCAACAVGNLVAHGMGIKAQIPVDDIDFQKAKENEHWASVLFRFHGPHFLKDKGEKCVESTDFTKEELIHIEEAFEHNTKIFWDDYYKYSKQEIRADQLKGLEAVVEVMLQFDNQQDSVQEVFTNKAQLITI